MNEIIKEISARIEAVEKQSRRANVGTIISLADGVARLNGLSEVMYNEMVDFGGGVIGIALNLGARRSRVHTAWRHVRSKGRRRGPHYRKAFERSRWERSVGKGSRRAWQAA